jgi:uncharacterized UBP type Zn finger protein
MAQECPHLTQVANLQPPKLSQSVHREECTQCFDNQVRNAHQRLKRLNSPFCEGPACRNRGLLELFQRGLPRTSD